MTNSEPETITLKELNKLAEVLKEIYRHDLSGVYKDLTKAAKSIKS